MRRFLIGLILVILGFLVLGLSLALDVANCPVIGHCPSVWKTSPTWYLGLTVIIIGAYLTIRGRHEIRNRMTPKYQITRRQANVAFLVIAIVIAASLTLFVEGRLSIVWLVMTPVIAVLIIDLVLQTHWNRMKREEADHTTKETGQR